MSVAELSIEGLKAGFCDRSLSVTSVAETLLARIDALNSSIGAVLAVDSERVRGEAGVLDSANDDDRNRPLFGIPFLVKDVIDVAGTATTCQSRASCGNIVARTAPVAQRLLDAGALYLGKTTLDEYALGGPTFEQPWPLARNPWRSTHTPGASSSGSGAALAAGMAPLALGTDTGGSIRSPAAMCGVVGLKPTFGALPMEGVFPLAPSMDVVGPMTRSVEDLCLAYAVLSGKTAPAPLDRAYGDPPKLAVLDTIWRHELQTDPDVRNALEMAIDDIESAGSKPVPVPFPPLAVFNAVGWTTLYAEAYDVHRLRLADRPQDYGYPVRNMLLTGHFFEPVDRELARKMRGILRERVDDVLRHRHAIISVVSAQPACPIDDTEAMARLDASSARVMCNATGHPAVALPIGATSDGLPIGLQIIGRRGDDSNLLHTAKWVENAVRSWPVGQVAPVGIGSSPDGTLEESSA